MRAINIITALEKIFPISSGMLGDNNGKNFYFTNARIKKVAIALDLTLDIAKSLVKKKIKMIILHHPILFNEYNEEIKNPIKKAIINIIEKNKICCYVIHTNYNVSSIGINTKILKAINANNITLLNKNDVTKIGFLNSELVFSKIIFNINKIFNLKYAKYIGELNNKIKKIAVCSGAGNGALPFIDESIDLFITGELKWSSCIELAQKNVNVLLLGHYMETFFINDLGNIIKENIKNIDIIHYQKDNILNVFNY